MFLLWRLESNMLINYIRQIFGAKMGVDLRTLSPLSISCYILPIKTRDVKNKNDTQRHCGTFVLINRSQGGHSND